MTATLVVGLLRRYWTWCGWMFLSSLVCWLVELLTPMDRAIQPAVAAAFLTQSVALLFVTITIAQDKSVFVLPLTRVELGRAMWQLAVLVPSGISGIALTAAATIVAVFSPHIRISPWWIVMALTCLIGGAGSIACVLTWRQTRAFVRRPDGHVLLLLVVSFVWPVIAGALTPRPGGPIGTATWVALLVMAALTISGFRHADTFAVFQRSLMAPAAARSAARNGRTVAIGRAHFAGRLAPLRGRLTVDLSVGALTAFLVPAVTAIIVPGARLRELIATSPRGSSNYAMTVWIALFSVAGSGLWQPSPWGDQRRLRTLPLGRTEIVSFYLLRSVVPVAAFLAVTLLLNRGLNGSLPSWLTWPPMILLCGVSALAVATARPSTVSTPQFPSSSFLFVAGGVTLGMLRVVTSESAMQTTAVVVGLVLFVAAAAIHRRRLMTMSSSMRPKRSRFAPAERR